jgi:hypothetical protein
MAPPKSRWEPTAIRVLMNSLLAETKSDPGPAVQWTLTVRVESDATSPKALLVPNVADTLLRPSLGHSCADSMRRQPAQHNMYSRLVLVPDERDMNTLLIGRVLAGLQEQRPRVHEVRAWAIKLRTVKRLPANEIQIARWDHESGGKLGRLLLIEGEQSPLKSRNYEAAVILCEFTDATVV